MPIYRTSCEDCGAQDDIFRSIQERDNLPSCGICGGKVARILTPTFLAPDIEPYVSPATGEVIVSRRQRHEEMRRTGYITWEPGLDKQIAERRKENQQTLDPVVAKEVDEIVTVLNSTGKLETSNAA